MNIFPILGEGGEGGGETGGETGGIKTLTIIKMITANKINKSFSFIFILIKYPPEIKRWVFYYVKIYYHIFLIILMINFNIRKNALSNYIFPLFPQLMGFGCKCGLRR